MIETLKLDFNDCAKLENVDGLGGLDGLTYLKSLELSFRRCSQIPNIDGMKAITTLPTLKSFALNLGECSRLVNVDGLQATMKDAFMVAASSTLRAATSSPQRPWLHNWRKHPLQRSPCNTLERVFQNKSMSVVHESASAPHGMVQSSEPVTA